MLTPRTRALWSLVNLTAPSGDDVGPYAGIQVNGTANLAVELLGGGLLQLTGVQGFLPLAVSKVRASGTTGSGHKAYQWSEVDWDEWTDYNLSQIPGWNLDNVEGFDNFPTTMQRALPAGVTTPPGLWRNPKTLADILSEIRSDAGWTFRYVDPINGNDNNTALQPFDPANPSQQTGPWKSLRKSVEYSGDIGHLIKLCVVVTDGAIFRFNSSGADPWRGLSSIYPKVQGFAVVNQSALNGRANPDLGWTSSMEVLPSTSWTLKVGTDTVWQADIPVSNGTTNVPTFNWSTDPAEPGVPTRLSGGVWDDTDIDEFGAPRQYICSNGATDVDTRAYSYWYDNTLRRFFVNTGRVSVSSTEGLRLFANVNNAILQRDDTPVEPPDGPVDRQVILINGTFEGGGYPLRANDSIPNATLRLNLTAYGCTFTRARAGLRGLFIETPGHIELLNCKAMLNGNDGVSYYPIKGNGYDDALVLTFIESGCQWFLNGYPSWVSVTNPYLTVPTSKVNGSTCHNACSGIRIATSAYWNAGPNFGDSAVSGYARVLNLGCWAHSSLGLQETSDYATDYALYGSNSVGATPKRRGAQGWLIDCPLIVPSSTPSGSQYYILLDKDSAGTTDRLPLLRRNGPAPTPLVRLRNSISLTDAYVDITGSYV
ncbi:hypothetical protein MCEMSE15_02712 [Fimbriimonadaceae bacterium]